jgi:hypothetical protein
VPRSLKEDGLIDGVHRRRVVIHDHEVVLTPVDATYHRFGHVFRVEVRGDGPGTGPPCDVFHETRRRVHGASLKPDKLHPSFQLIECFAMLWVVGVDAFTTVNFEL